VRPRNDIAIYSPFAHTFYEDPASSAGRSGSGGAELQATLLARHMSRRGMRVAHIVYALESPAPAPREGPVVVERPRRAASRGSTRLGRGLGKLVDCLHVWRALVAADARLYLFRTGLSGGSTGFVTGAMFCLLRRRRLVFAASNDLDFIFGRSDRSWLVEALYRFALRRSRRVVVQTHRQLALARRVLDPARVTPIPSFAEPADPCDAAADNEGFLWAGRLVDYKLPLRYLELARSVPEARFRMIVGETGETPESLAAQVISSAAEIPNLELEPEQDRERVLQLISRCTAVVVTSGAEGMPNLFLEAWARGVPILSLHFDPDGRMAEEGIGICASGLWEGFVSSARQLWSDGTLRRELGERGRAYVHRMHSPNAVATRWAKVLSEALA